MLGQAGWTPWPGALEGAVVFGLQSMLAVCDGTGRSLPPLNSMFHGGAVLLKLKGGNRSSI